VRTGNERDNSIDLEEGSHVAICFLPDHLGDSTGRPHFLLGMMQEFRVGAP
jgi:hypothetical protein